MNKKKLLELVKKYNSPLYVYDSKKIKHQYKVITNAFSQVKNVKINYACKAL